MRGGKLKIYIFRHGQTDFNRDERFTGLLDSKLTELGKKQAGIIARKLKNKKFQVAFQTRLSRSKDTLKPVIENHPECVIVVNDDRMIERDYGKISGKSHAEIIKKYGQEKYEEWHRGYYPKDRPPGGESFSDVEKRVRSFVNDLKRFMKKNKVNVAISAHGNSIRLFRKIMENASVKDTISWKIPYDKFFEYEV